MLKQFLGNSRGVSLIQGMMVGTVLAAGALVTTKVINDQKLALNDAHTRGHIEQLHDLVFSVMENQANCTETITGLSITPNLLGLNVPAIKNQGGTLAYQVYDGTPATTYLDGNVVIKNMRIFTGPDLFGDTFTSDIKTMDTTGGNRLVITYQRLSEDTGINLRQRRGFGGKEINKVISIIFQGTPGNLTCFGAKNENWELLKDMCENVKIDSSGAGVHSLFEWDDLSNTCKPRHNVCPPDRVFVGVSSLGNAICNRLEDQMNLRDIINTTPDASQNCAMNPNTRLEVYYDSGAGYNKVRVRCGPVANCAAGTVTWGACSSAIGAGTHSQTVPVSDPLPAPSGSATFGCRNGAWVPMGMPLFPNPSCM